MTDSRFLQNECYFKDFDPHSGSLLERFIFDNRRIILVIYLLVTVVLGFQTTKLRMNAGYEKMIPRNHPYVVNFIENSKELSGLGNAVRIAVETKEGTILDAGYLETLRQINDEASFLPAVDRSWMKSLWTRSMRWMAVTEYGLDGAPVMPDPYVGSPENHDVLSRNIERSGEIGRMVAPDLTSSIVHVPLLEIDPDTGQRLDYFMLSQKLEELRTKYEKGNIVVHITGFAKIVGDLIDGLYRVVIFFLVAIAITTMILYGYTRCARCTFMVVGCSLVAVVWQLGLLTTLGFELDPYAILVPFLVFAIGMSTGAQKMNGIMLDIGRGADRIVAARLTFRRLFVPGVTALSSDMLGFAALFMIKIQVIQELAVSASLGVATLIFTNLILVPLLLSFTGVNGKATLRSLRHELAESKGNPVWRFLGLFTQRKGAAVAVVACALMGVVGLHIRGNLKIGDLDPGAPELRPDSRYNRDNAFMVREYSASSDVLVVMVKTPPFEGTLYKNLKKIDELEWQLQQVEGVDATASFAKLTRVIMAGLNEGDIKWYDLFPNQDMINSVTVRVPRELFNTKISLLPLFVFLEDHKAETLTRVVNKVEEFAAQNNTRDQQFLLAAGSAGIEAATNIVVKEMTHKMLYLIYGVVILLCYITFRSWLAVAAAVIPLMLTSVLCEALMVRLGIGVKVATLPVIALGVGVGVDYALYVLSVTLQHLRAGLSLWESYQRALRFTGKVVVLISLTLSISVGTWVFSPIKFQADMGLLLAFMFLWNMLGALVLLPAILYFLPPVRKKKSMQA